MSFPEIKFSFPEETVFELTHGDCWVLAASLSHVAKLPYATIYGDGVIEHVGVELPDGRIVDIEGIWDPVSWESRWYEELEAFEVYLGCSPEPHEGEDILHTYDTRIETLVYGDLSLTEIRDQILRKILS